MSKHSFQLLLVTCPVTGSRASSVARDDDFPTLCAVSTTDATRVVIYTECPM
jgi:hypothetical protein